MPQRRRSAPWRSRAQPRVAPAQRHRMLLLLLLLGRVALGDGEAPVKARGEQRQQRRGWRGEVGGGGEVGAGEGRRGEERGGGWERGRGERGEGGEGGDQT